MAFAALIGVSFVNTPVDPGLITTNPLPSKLTVGGVEVVLDEAQGTGHKGGGVHAAKEWSVIAVSKLTVGSKTVAITGNLATCSDVVIAIPNKLSIL